MCIVQVYSYMHICESLNVIRYMREVECVAWVFDLQGNRTAILTYVILMQHLLGCDTCATQDSPQADPCVTRMQQLGGVPAGTGGYGGHAIFMKCT